MKLEPTKPKVFYFSEKPEIPLLLKALSNNFNKKINIGIVTKDATDVIEFFKVKKYPTIYVVKEGHPKPHLFKGEFNYRSIFEFLNVFSE